uniref:Uncharacterized protein n=1 Tax=Tanacetum cinerariifolium TaxID=118510 RepID=A0A699GQB4_TANCI|nr:hypothetical protein [Tanacetum cinerariifolium]
MIPAIYIQQFWDTMCFNLSTGLYSYQLDEQCFNLHKYILRDALDITPTNDNNPFVAHPQVIQSSNTSILWDTQTKTSCTADSIRKNLAKASRRKNKTTHLLILSIRFTKLIIYHLKTKHNMHPRSSLPLHYSHDESVLNTLRYVRKDGREIFSMSIPDALHTNEIKGAPYYGEYQEHVSKPKAAKATKPASDPKLKPTPTQPPKVVPEKKRKLVQETPDVPSPAKRSKGGRVRKIHKPLSSLKLVDEPSAEDVPGPARPVVIREPDSKRFHPLPEVQGKGKEKVIKEQATRDLLTLQYPKNKSSMDQFIFQMRIPMPAEASGPAESPSLDVKLALTDSETKSDDEVPKINTKDQDEGQDGPNPGIQDEGQAGPNPGAQDEGQAGSNLGDAVGSEPQSSHVVHVVPNLEPMDLEAIDALHLQKPEQLDEDDQFFVKKQQEEEPGKTNAEAEAMQAPLRARFSYLPTVDVKEILQQQMFERKSYEAHEDHKKLYDALKKSLERDYSDQLLSDLNEARQKKKETSIRIFLVSPHLLLYLLVHLSDDEDSRNDHLPIADSRKGCGNHYLQRKDQRLLNLLGPFLLLMYHMLRTTGLLHQVDWTNLEGDQVRIDVNRPLPLGDPPGHVIIQLQFFFNKDLEYLRHGSKGSSPALSISKMKAANYPDFGLKLLVPKQMWIEDVCAYDISAKYGISHWWFNRHKFYIDRHDSPSHRKEVRSHMRILSVFRIKAYSRYGYDYLSKIILRRADLQEHTIAEKDFKNLHPSDFEDLNLLFLQGHLNHLPGSNKKMLSTAVKLWTQNLVIQQRVKDFQFNIESYQTQLNLTKPG